MLPNVRDKFTNDWRQIDWRRTILLVLLILAIAATLWQYFMPQVKEINTTTFKRVKEIQKVKDVQRVYIPCPEKGLVALDRAAVAKRLDMPELQEGTASNLSVGESLPYVTITKSATVEPLATAELPRTDNGHQVVAVLDTDTGVTTMVVKETPAPWFQFRNDGAVGIRYGIDQHLLNTGEVYGRWDFMRMKDVYFSINGRIETGGDAKLQTGAEYRW